MKLFFSILILFASLSAWSREIRLCDQGLGDFSGKTAIVILDLVEKGELNIHIQEEGLLVASYSRFFIDGEQVEFSNWGDQQAEATASYDKVSDMAFANFTTPNQTFIGSFINCALVSN